MSVTRSVKEMVGRIESLGGYYEVYAEEEIDEWGVHKRQVIVRQKNPLFPMMLVVREDALPKFIDVLRDVVVRWKVGDARGKGQD